MTARQRISRTRETILAGVDVVDGCVWVECGNCGGSGNYPSNMAPAGRCRFYCWSGREGATFGKIPIEVERYVRKAQARDRREYHARVRHEDWLIHHKRGEGERQARASTPDPRIKALADLYGLPVTDTYGAQAIADAGQDKSTTVGYATSLIEQWVRRGELSEVQWNAVEIVREREKVYQVERAAETKRRAASDFIGTSGERSDFLLTVKARREFTARSWNERDSMLITFTDDDGNTVIWWTSPRRIEPGDRYQVRGTVKDHKVYRDERQTVLTRCKLTTPQRPE